MKDFTDMNDKIYMVGGRIPDLLGKYRQMSQIAHEVFGPNIHCYTDGKDQSFIKKILSGITSIFTPGSEENQNDLYSHTEDGVPHFDNNNNPMESMNNDS